MSGLNSLEINRVLEQRSQLRSTWVGVWVMADSPWLVSGVCIFLTLSVFLCVPKLIENYFFYLCLGIFLFTLVEYTSHRFTFHVLLRRQIFKTRAAIVHMSHHADPKQGINAGPLLGLVVFAVGFIASFGVSRNLNVSLEFACGLMLGFVLYDVSHYLIHLDSPPTKYHRMQQRLHWFHHERNWNVNYGISSCFWDLIFGTLDLKVLKQNEKNGSVATPIKSNRKI